MGKHNITVSGIQYNANEILSFEPVDNATTNETSFLHCEGEDLLAWTADSDYERSFWIEHTTQGRVMLTLRSPVGAGMREEFEKIKTSPEAALSFTDNEIQNRRIEVAFLRDRAAGIFADLFYAHVKLIVEWQKIPKAN